MKHKVQLKHSKTGKITSVKVGWNWIFFLSFSVLGILFEIFISGQFQSLQSDAEQAGFAVRSLMGLIATLGLSIWFGIKGNKMMVKSHLKNGWEFVNPDSEDVKFAKDKWKLT